MKQEDLETLLAALTSRQWRHAASPDEDDVQYAKGYKKAIADMRHELSKAIKNIGM